MLDWGMAFYKGIEHLSKRFWLLLVLLLLSSCNTLVSSVPTATTPTAQTSARHNQLTAEALSPVIKATQNTPPTIQTATNSVSSPSIAAPSSIVDSKPSPTPALPAFSYPIGVPGRPLGDGFFIRHGVAVENTWYNPGWWHTGEDWYAVEGDTAGARVYAVADGDIVYIGANYPGRVVIVRHANDLYSMYGHLDPALAVREGQHVSRGDLLGMVLRRGDRTPNHLHFEIRSFLLQREVNGNAPRYRYRCGVQCPPGPGYWPIDAPDLPIALGWRNPTHVIAQRGLAPGTVGEVIVATRPASTTITLWSAPPRDSAAQALETLPIQSGQYFALLAVWAGPADTPLTSALAYELWYHIQLPNNQHGWVQAAIPSTIETGSDGRPSSVSFNFFPAISTAP